MDHPTGRRSAYLDEAIALLEEHGPAHQTLGLSASIACTATGISRTQLYRRFASLRDLDDAVLGWLGAGPGDWRARLCACDPAAPLQASLGAALRSPVRDLGPTVRALVVSWDHDHPGRQRIVEAERSRLHELGRWLDAHLAAHDRRPRRGVDAADIALALTALLEGHAVLWVHGRATGPHRCEHEDGPRLIERAQRMVDQMASPGATALPSSDAAVWPAAAGRDLDVGRFLDARADRLHGWRPAPRRLVHVGRLARRLGLSERRVYALWPTVREMNDELGAHILRTELQAHDRFARSALDRRAQHPDEPPGLWAAQVFGDLAHCSLDRRANYFALVPVLWQPRALPQIPGLLERWSSEVRRSMLAHQALMGVSRRRGVGPDELASTLRETVLGFQRLMSLHPELCERTSVIQDEKLSTVGVLLTHVGSSLVI